MTGGEDGRRTGGGEEGRMEESGRLDCQTHTTWRLVTGGEGWSEREREREREGWVGPRPVRVLSPSSLHLI